MTSRSEFFLCVFLAVATISFVDGAGVIETDDVILNQQQDDEQDMCSLDQVAAILCDICAEVNGDVSRGNCCSDPGVLYRCEKLILAFLPVPENTGNDDSFNEINDQDGDDSAWLLKDNDEKRASWGWGWKPHSSRMNNPYRYDRDGFFGKRSSPMEEDEEEEEPLYDNGEEEQEVSKRARYPGRYDWKPAPYRLDPYMFGASGKRTLWYNRRLPGRYDWKPMSQYGDMEKRGRWDWKPPAYRLDNPWSNSYYRYMGKRFNLGPGRWNWKPHSSQPREQKRGRFDWKPATGYFDYGLGASLGGSGYGGRVEGKRPVAQFDWKPRPVRPHGSLLDRVGVQEEKRSRYSWKPWKPAAYNMPSQWSGKK